MVVIIHFSSNYTNHSKLKEVVKEDNKLFIVKNIIYNNSTLNKYTTCEYDNYLRHYINPYKPNKICVNNNLEFICEMFYYPSYIVYDASKDIKPIVEEFPELSDAYEIYFIDKDNILMYNHNIPYKDLNNEESIIMRFISTINHLILK